MSFPFLFKNTFTPTSPRAKHQQSCRVVFRNDRIVFEKTQKVATQPRRLYTPKPLSDQIRTIESRFRTRSNPTKLQLTYIPKDRPLSRQDLKTLQTIETQHHNNQTYIKRIEALNDRQDVILVNALQFINDTVKSPNSYTGQGVDEGFVCKIQGNMKLEYLKMLSAKDTGLFGKVNLKDKSVALEMVALKKLLK